MFCSEIGDVVDLMNRTEMCHGDAARDVNPVEINLVEEELRHTAGCDARNPSPFGGRGKEGHKSKPRHSAITGSGLSYALLSPALREPKL